MAWLNYHHLLYFYTVAREGGVARAARALNVTEPTISVQVRARERAFGTRLFEKAGRGLALTAAGRLAYRYAEEIFTTGRDLQEAMAGRDPTRPRPLVVGIADAVPKLIAYRILEPALQDAQHPLVCHDDAPERLLLRLAAHELDAVISDAPVPPTARVRAFSHLLGECGVSVMGTAALARRYRRGFPGSLEGAPVLFPPQDSTLRRSLDAWLEELGVRPQLRGEVADSALLKVFGQAGAGLVAVPEAIEREVQAQYGLRLVGRVPELRERFYLLSAERRLRHPGVVALTVAARALLFAE